MKFLPFLAFLSIVGLASCANKSDESEADKEDGAATELAKGEGVIPPPGGEEGLPETGEEIGLPELTAEDQAGQPAKKITELDGFIFEDPTGDLPDSRDLAPPPQPVLGNPSEITSGDETSLLPER
ncbi:hypothetical protein [Roseibacillus ishigakijimensis]|uniref:Uncharacterized protein n=1 Tax=Roseibacillus ishigakijimensis TaxID=454146 RepID=A0A934RNT1_9BACT|nr:hypothetical protein [Roseibacillus ishigakijimensis]MBK1834220.1 hypothetical protein [Roseibacillus ishigakijimensis]